MIQKLKDLQLTVAGSRKAQVILVAALLGVLAFFFAPSSGPRSRLVKPPIEKKVETGRSTQDEASQDLMTRFKADFDDLKKRNEDSKQELEDLKKQQSDYEQRTAEIFKKMLERIAENPGSAPGDQTSALSPSVPAPVELGEQGTTRETQLDNQGGQLALQTQETTLESFGSLNAPEVAPPPPPEAKKIAYVGAGDSVRVKLLAGVNAPTDGTPYPVVFKLVGDINGPDGSTLPLGEARVIAAAQGSLTDSRALFRLTSLNIRLPSGQRKVVNVDGWIVGEDGVRGMQGVLIDPIGKAIAGAGFAGALAGFGTGVSSARTQVSRNPAGGYDTQVTGDVGEYAAGTALSASAREWSSIIRERLREMVPVVQVLSGREGTAVFARSLKIEDLYDQLEDDEGSASSMD